jgi:hypothetical protein
MRIPWTPANELVFLRFCCLLLFLMLMLHLHCCCLVLPPHYLRQHHLEQIPATRSSLLETKRSYWALQQACEDVPTCACC